MAESPREKIKSILLVFAALSLAGCANQLPPGGGEIDKTPPEIVSSYPLNGSTNFSDDYIELDFSEYVVKRTLRNAIFISPAIDGETEIDWSGTSARIYFPSKLKSDRTYVVTIGTDVVDINNNNRMAHSYNFIFSTGPKIDRGEISGKVFDPNADGVLIYAYLKGDSTINPVKMKPDYISQTGKDGTYTLFGLAPGGYRVFAVKDQFRDLLYNPGQDAIGVPYKDIILSASDSVFAPLNFFLTKTDTVKPRIISAVMTDKFHMLVKFTKAIDSSIVKSRNFVVFDSTTQNSMQPIFAYSEYNNKSQAVLVIDSTLNITDNVTVTVDTLRDKSGNVFLSDLTSADLSDRPDTTKPSIAAIQPPNGAGDVDFKDAEFNFFLNDAVDTSAAREGISFADTLGKSVSYSVNFNDNASFKIIPSNELKPKTDYRIKIDLSKFKDAAGNFYDSVFVYKFSTINGLDFTGVSGSVENADSSSDIEMVLQGTDKAKTKYTQKLHPDMKFKFERIQPGNYMLWCYSDSDSSGTYSFGNPLPFKPSEHFSFYPDSLNLRARWSVTDIRLLFK